MAQIQIDRMGAAVTFLCCAIQASSVSFVLAQHGAMAQSSERTLLQWHMLMKDVDPKSVAAAALVQPLIAIVADDNIPGADREPVAAFLARMGKPAQDVVPVLERLLEQRSIESTDYLWAARALALMGAPANQATPAIAEFLNDTRIPAEQRQAAMEALAMIGATHPDAIDALVGVLQHPPAAPGQHHAFESNLLQRLAADAIAVIGPDAESAAPLLIRLVRNDRNGDDVRRSAIVALGALRSRGAVAETVLVEELLQGRSAAIRDVAAQALIRIGPPVTTSLLRALEHPESDIRWRIVFYARELVSPDVIAQFQTPMRLLIHDTNEFVSMSAAETWQTLYGNEEFLLATGLRLLSASDRSVRIRAKHLLLSMRPLSEAQKHSVGTVLKQPRLLGSTRETLRELLQNETSANASR